MLVILVVIGTKYACNLTQDWDHICLEIWFKRGPSMPAISVSIGTIYACNRICLQSPIFLNSFLTREDHFQGVLKNFEIAGIYGDHIMVPIETEIAGIFGPLLNQDCWHIWSPSRLRLQEYLVPKEIVIAGIFGPYLDRYCRHNRSPLIFLVIINSNKSLETVIFQSRIC